ncbi:kinase-like domain-containing protein [Stachybotrys elegans]|uniref:EKC/KEOPS complex subunit BUD32 n=1 Tax=Stachybotrys elegans TaxID=80388 RepID=A0A8K0SGE7_9HYPO|nr:kinase-like domain-containing protein [Stachybotrys elegans]
MSYAMSIVKHFGGLPFLAAIWQSAITQGAAFWNLFLRLLGRQSMLSLETKVNKEAESVAPPHHITYKPIPGSWQRREHPNWPESVFRIPETVPHGTIYYITKGKQVGGGATSHVELLPSGDIVKSPKSNPYSPKEEEDHRRDMRIEAEAYRRLGNCPYTPRLVDWDPESCCLTLEYLEKGDLATYMTKTAQIPGEIRQRWALQAAAALAALHAVDIVHCDVTPRNFMLSAALDLHIADFAGSSIAGSAPTTAAGPRFLPPGWSWHRAVEKTDDIFALGSVIYFVIVGEEPYAGLEEEEVEKLFGKAIFPDVSGLVCGAVIRGCWDGAFKTSEQVINSLNNVYDTNPRAAQVG